MSKGWKIALALIVDMLVLGLIVFAVWKLCQGNDVAWKNTLFKWMIVLAIPCMFFLTFTSFAGDKFDTLPADLQDDAEEDTEEDADA